MAVRRDNRYRGRRAAPPQRKSGHLRTNYTEDDIELFKNDLKKLRAVWPKEMIEGDRRVQKRRYLKTVAIICSVIGVPATIVAVWMAASGEIPWWMVPAAQSVAVIYALWVWFVDGSHGDDDISVLIYREADRRGIKYTKDVTPLYHIMNRINADYNSRLWNRTFKWQ